MNFKKLEKISKKKIENKIFFVRASLNVPIKKLKNKTEKKSEKKEIENDFRLTKNLETINFLKKNKAKIILSGHIGSDGKENFDLVAKWFEKKYKKNFSYDKNTFKNFSKEKLSEKIENLKGGEILLLDNIRKESAEKRNCKKFAKNFSSLFDFYVNEAFSVSHRKHMSVDSLPKNFAEKKGEEKIFLGLQYQKELKNIEKIKKILEKKKSLFILGGSKISTKIPMIEKAMDKFDMIILGGALANNFYKKMGFEVGKSLVEKDFSLSEKKFQKIINSPKIFLPNIVMVQNGEKEICDVKKNDKILDISPNSFFEIEEKILGFDFVFLNGPMGFYEGGYLDGSKKILKILEKNKKKYLVAGGGNTISLLKILKSEKKADFISTGGGALVSKILE